MSQLPSEYRILEMASKHTPDTNIFIIIIYSSFCCKAKTVIFIPDQLTRLLYRISPYLLKQERAHYQRYFTTSEVSDAAEFKVFGQKSNE